MWRETEKFLKAKITITFTLVFYAIVLPVSQHWNYCNYAKNTTIIWSTLQLDSAEHFWQFIWEVKNEEFLSFFFFAIIYREISIFCALINRIKKEWRRNCSLWFPLINQALLSSTRSRSFFIYEHFFTGVRNGWVSERRWKIFKFLSQKECVQMDGEIVVNFHMRIIFFHRRGKLVFSRRLSLPLTVCFFMYQTLGNQCSIYCSHEQTLELLFMWQQISFFIVAALMKKKKNNSKECKKNIKVKEEW